MSLEAKIELLTAAVVELTRVMQMQNTNPEDAYYAGKREHEAEETRGGLTHEEYQNARLPKAAEEIPNDPPKSSPTTDTSPPTSQASVSYDDVKAVTIAVSKIDKNKAVAGLARFGAKNAKELQETQWSDYVVYMKRVASGEIDPESSHE